MNKKHDCVEELHQLGYRATPARLGILQTLEHAKRPLSASEIAQILPDVNEVTVYRTLEVFAKKGLLRVGEKERVMRYSYAARSHHHHMVCEDCGYTTNCATCA